MRKRVLHTQSTGILAYRMTFDSILQHFGRVTYDTQPRPRTDISIRTDQSHFSSRESSKTKNTELFTSAGHQTFRALNFFQDLEVY